MHVRVRCVAVTASASSSRGAPLCAATVGPRVDGWPTARLLLADALLLPCGHCPTPIPPPPRPALQLPIKYVGYSTCFRKEAGSHGRDTLGIFR